MLCNPDTKSDEIILPCCEYAVTNIWAVLTVGKNHVRSYEEIKFCIQQRVRRQTLRKGCGHTEQKLKTNAQKIAYSLNNAVHLGDKVGERRKKCDVQKESKIKPDRFIV